MIQGQKTHLITSLPLSLSEKTIEIDRKGGNVQQYVFK
jgi:hypothetical protein